MVHAATILAIDPGYDASAWLLYQDRPVAHGIDRNPVLLARVSHRGQFTPAPTVVVIEQMESFGMPVGREILGTVWWAGRLWEGLERTYGSIVEQISRKAVKLALCGNPAAKDANVRLALLDRFGGKRVAIGLKRTPGPLYGLKSHDWSALALALTWLDARRLAESSGVNG